MGLARGGGTQSRLPGRLRSRRLDGDRDARCGGDRVPPGATSRPQPATAPACGLRRARLRHRDHRCVRARLHLRVGGSGPLAYLHPGARGDPPVRPAWNRDRADRDRAHPRGRRMVALGTLRRGVVQCRQRDLSRRSPVRGRRDRRTAHGSAARPDERGAHARRGSRGAAGRARSPCGRPRRGQPLRALSSSLDLDQAFAAFIRGLQGLVPSRAWRSCSSSKGRRTCSPWQEKGRSRSSRRGPPG